MASTHYLELGNKMKLAVLLTGITLLAEIVGGLLSNSLALLSDAGHVLTDFVALGLSWFALIQASRPATARMTFGYHRLGIITALVNAVSLVGIVIYIFWEAYHRWQNPEPVNSLLMLVVALAGLAVNVVVVLWLHSGAKHNLNVRSAFWHALGDGFASLGVIAGGLFIYFTGFYLADIIVSLLIGTVIAVPALNMIKEVYNIIMEASPSNLDSMRIAEEISSVPGVKGVHDLHVWSVAPGIQMLSGHVLVENVPVKQGNEISRDVAEMLEDKYHIGHCTIQLECENCESGALFCSLEPSHGHEEEEHKH